MKSTRIRAATAWRAACLALAFISAGAMSAPITNNDVIKLLEAGMAEDVVLQAIGAGQPRFDTSASALVRLKEKGATPAILKAMITAGSGGGTVAAPVPSRPGAQPSAASATLNPEEVLLVVDGQETAMQYIVPNMRVAARALGWGGFASYASLSGTMAQKRLKNASPQFIVSVPKNAQPASYLTLANFVVRPNGTREVITGGGYMSYSTGIHRDRVVQIQSEPLTDQSRARDGFVLYRVSPAAPLSQGEYALVLYTREVRVVGFFGGGTSNSFFDFGID